MKQKLINISSKLISYSTTANNQSAIDNCFQYIEKLLSPYMSITKEYIHNNIKSVIWLTSETKTPDIMLNGHIDVVPAATKMFTQTRDDHKLYGRGVADMKSGIAAFIVAIETISKKSNQNLPSIGIMITSDEESGGQNGVNYLVNTIGYNPKIVIIPDGGKNNHIVENTKGVLHLLISATGKSAHASNLWAGDNAIIKISNAIQNIQKYYPQPKKPIWKTTVNIGQIKGGSQTNQVPDYAQIILDIRYIPKDNPETIKQKIKNICPECQVKQLILAKPFHIDKNNPYIKKWAKLISPKTPLSKIMVNEHGASDARYFDSSKTTVILSAPIFGDIHSPNEWIDIKSLVSYTKIIINYVLNS